MEYLKNAFRGLMTTPRGSFTPVAELEAMARSAQLQAEVEHIIVANIDTLLAELYIKTYGMQITNEYQKYIATLTLEYCMKVNIVNPITQCQLLKESYPKHLMDRLNNTKKYSFNEIQHINKFNQQISGVAVDNYFWPYQRVETLKSFPKSPTMEDESTPLIINLLKGLVVVTACTAAASFIFRQSKNLMNIFITQTHQIQPTPHFPNDIFPSSCPNTYLVSAGNYTNILNHSSNQLRNLVEIITLAPYPEINKNFINKLLNGWMTITTNIRQ
nr:hypothetical protein [Odonatan tombus-related virus]